MKERVCVIGEGAWGTAVATLLAENGFAVVLWCHDEAVAQQINHDHINNRYLPDILLDPTIQATTDLKEAICDVRWVFEAIPVKYLRSVLEKTVSCFSREQIWVILSKGIEKDSLLLPSQIIDDVFGYKTKKAVFAGPSFAYDLARKQPTAVTVAATDCAVGLELQKMIANSYFRPYVSLDLLGVQVGGAIKNVLALGVGLLDGAGFGDNAQAFILTRGLHEMVQLSQALGGKEKTMYGLSGVGDLVLTAMGKLSKNLAVGKRLGKGDSLETILQETGYIPEGINTVQSINQLIIKKNLELPICQGIYQVIFEGRPISAMLTDLMEQPLEQECLTD